jgi:RHS repeat-associated protein
LGECKIRKYRLANSNLKTDANKSISNITYNYLNLPEQISVTGKGTITYTYDALGGKRSKTVTESGVSVTYKGQTYAGITITTANYYENTWVYESKSYSDITLQNGLGYATKALFSGHEDGRIRPIYSNNTLTAFAGDYFIKDHLGNIRMVLTDEQQVNYYPATTLEGTYSYTAREVNSLVNHEKKFYRIDPVFIVNKPWLSTTLDYQNHNNVPLTNPNPNYPPGVGPLRSATSKKVYSLNAGTNRTGLEMVIKVMAGDKIDIFGRSYHSNGSAVSNSNSTPLSILQIMSGIISSPSNAISSKGITASQLESWNSSLLPSTFIRGQNFETGTTIPKAYINYIFLDEQFRYVSGGASRVGNYGEVKQHWSELSNLAAQKNGYLLVYVSNESNFTVYFDNLQVVHKPGPIVEETHYYPFGLVMNGISSKGLNASADNKLKFNGKEEHRKEFYDGSGLDWLDYDARMYDNQIGRWYQVDPFVDEPEQLDKSPYAAFWNNPIMYDDPDGKCPNCLTSAIGAGIGALLGGGVEIALQLYKNGSVNNWSAVGGSALQGGITGGAAGFTGGATLLATAAVAGGANALGASANRAIQGQVTTLTNIATDAIVGGVLGVGGKLVGNTVSGGTNNLSNSAKGKLGEAITEIKYGAQGYKSAGKAEILTGGRTATGQPAKALYDHKMTNVVTGKQITVESKFNGSKLTPNQAAAQSRVLTSGGLIIDRTTSQGLGNGVKTAMVGAGSGIDAQRNKRP